MTEESTTVQKRGRGRPRKSDAVAQSPQEKKKPVKEAVELPSSESADDSAETEEDVAPQPTKSPAGKKRAASESQHDKNEPAPKRRGRPPKSGKAAQPSKDKKPASSGRGRGRPRKNP
ncbi:high mobility group protein HMGI-C-like [Anopheles moucheti]|uniref:high mobility group protein HMGI-C-like n=1 Tax=Anopheles moucheti TaxID=186751 RepID=UPI0022EFF7E5|nr:high mobility group protein HMGI-C-like [Anopheles moucheti]